MSERDEMLHTVSGFATDAAATLRDASGVVVDGPGLLIERSRLAGWAEPTPGMSVGGATQLVEASDGWFSLSLARPDDLVLLPALFQPPDHVGSPHVGEARDVGEAWDVVHRCSASLPRRAIVDRAALLGMSAAVVGESGADRPRVEVFGNRRPRAEALVVDLSALWAGPLCAHLLGLGGAQVVKVEDPRRPDGARFGPAAFYDALHAGHDTVAADFRSAAGRNALQRLCASADVVITSSRPRVFPEIGLDLDTMLRTQTISAWVCVTGFGLSKPDRVGFGDDAAVAAGLVAPGPAFVGDAVADPLTGLWAASVAASALQRGDVVRLDASLAGVTALAASWVGTHGQPGQPSQRPAAPATQRPIGPAAPVGRDTERWIQR